ncbi:MAG TPA: hypothetical protein VMM60_12510, partial [Ilumatobacter sp.]|nr:hypothetical protein [Ilumatobacter sp.]
MSNVSVPLWSTIQFWSIKSVVTQEKSGASWSNFSGTPQPNADYRIEIVWGPRLQVSAPENWLEHAQLRVVFDGWNVPLIDLQYRTSMQFYASQSFGQVESPAYRTAISR